MEKADTLYYASTNCFIRTFPNKKLFKVQWNIESSQFYDTPLEAKFNCSSYAGTCRLRKSDKTLTLEILLNFEFYCEVEFSNESKDVLYKEIGESFDDETVPEKLFCVFVDLDKLQNLPNDMLVIVFTVSTNEPRTDSYDSTHWSYIQDLLQIVNTQPSFLKEQVVLLIGEDAELVNKAVLCGNSSVIANVFKNDPDHPNIIKLDGIERRVLKNMIAFLNSGILRCDDFESVYALYGAANKCGIKKLQDACSRLLQLLITPETFTKVLFISEDLKDTRLKNEALSFFNDHADDILVTDQWNELMQNEVVLGLQAIAFRLRGEPQNDGTVANGPLCSSTESQEGVIMIINEGGSTAPIIGLNNTD